jgi:hypothetical protein
MTARQIGLTALVLVGLLFLAGGVSALLRAIDAPTFDTLVQGVSEVVAGVLLIEYALRRSGEGKAK